MIGDHAFVFWRPLADNDVDEWPSVREPAQAAGFVDPQTIRDPHASGQRRAKNSPGLIRPAWHRADVGEFRMGVLRSVTAAEGAHHPDKLAPELQTTFD